MRFEYNYKISGIYKKIHPESGDIREKKMGYYYADRELFEDIVSETGAEITDIHLPLYFEAADDIAYKTADIEDAFVKRFLTYHSLRDELRKLQNREKSMQTQKRKIRTGSARQINW